MAAIKLPEGYPNQNQLPLPKGNVRFAVTKKVFKFVIEESHRNPFNREKMMKAPEGMNLRWPGSNYVEVHPQSDPAVYMYLMTSPLCAQHPDFKGQAHKNIMFELFDPGKAAQASAEKAVLIGDAVKGVQEKFSGDLIIHSDELILACREAGIQPSGDPAMNLSALLTMAVSDPGTILTKALKHPSYVISEKLSLLVSEGLIVQEGSKFFVNGGEEKIDLGGVKEANALLTKPQSKLYKKIKPFITQTESDE